jgi:hypothetical protein
MIDYARALGFDASTSPESRHRNLVRYINLQLAGLGFEPVVPAEDESFATLATGLLDNYREKSRLLADYRCPVDQRIEDFLAQHFADLALAEPLRLPGQTFVLDRHGIARELSLPVAGNRFSNNLLTSYRVKNGILNNPASDRRTTSGTFHVAEGGLPIPGAKKAVPKHVFAALFREAFRAPADMMTLPFTAEAQHPTCTFVSLLLRPIVCPEIPGRAPRRTMEVRFFAPGSLVSNLDFVESIFGNAGDPYLPENDAGLDVAHWSGHTGCVILAPHLTALTKKELGLPHVSDATPRQQADGMCWSSPEEKYNDGNAFKVTCRTADGVMVTLIADNYYGYCKKEVKTQISYAVNLMGNGEEEHAGGAIAHASYSLGDRYEAETRRYNERTLGDVIRDYPALLTVHPEGYAVDKNYPRLVYVPHDAVFDLNAQAVTWSQKGETQQLRMAADAVYMTPSGYAVHMERHPASPRWRLVGTVGEPTFCHKPCTVSGGGKSEISKSLHDYMIYGPIFVSNLDHDLDAVAAIFERDFSNIYREPLSPSEKAKAQRRILSPERSLGSVIQLLTPSPKYSDEHNHWLEALPNYMVALVLVIKRLYKPEWGSEWRQHFHVDTVNGFPSHELKFQDRKVMGTYLRVGFLADGSWRTYKVRQDFIAARKVQTEDDISASVTVPARQLGHLNGAERAPSVKFVKNCEYRLFQRPDEAIHRGFDKQTERDLIRHSNFLCNFEPLDRSQVREIVGQVAEFETFTPGMQSFLKQCIAPTASVSSPADDTPFTVCSAFPRIVDGKPTKNPRYLQDRPDLVDPFTPYVSEMSVRLQRAVPAEVPVPLPVTSVLFGRRNNPAGKGIRALAVYNPIHYQELPELFMDFVSSLTGKSPSTTGAGSEGAMTKEPFNALLPTADLNAALVSYILTGLAGFSSAAGHVGPNCRVDHDISLLVPEIWCRLTPEERNPAYLIAGGMLEKLEDFEHNGEKIFASRLGYRITNRFCDLFLGRVFDNPSKVFDEAMLKPEKQDFEAYVDGIKNITEAHERVARYYLEDGSIEQACPPLKALLTIMATGTYEGKDASSPEIRRLFTLESLLASDWYRERLVRKQQVDVALWQRHLSYLEKAAKRTGRDFARSAIEQRKAYVSEQLARAKSAAYLDDLQGTLGVDAFS